MDFGHIILYRDGGAQYIIHRRSGGDVLVYIPTNTVLGVYPCAVQAQQVASRHQKEVC